MSTSNAIRQSYFQLHIAVFLAAFTGVLGDLIDLSEIMLVFYRMLITGITLWVLYGYTGKVRKLSKEDQRTAFLGGFLMALHWVCFYGSIKYANVSVALVCFSASGFFSAIIEPLMNRTKIDIREVLLGSMVVFGIYIIFHFDTQFKTGILLGIAAAFLSALFPMYSRRLVLRQNVETVLIWQMTYGLLGLVVLLPGYLYLFPTDKYIPGPMDWSWLLILAWVCTVFAQRLATSALRHLSVFTVSLSYNLEPVYGILMAFILLGEGKDMSQWFFVGFAIIVVSVAIHGWLSYRKAQSLKRESSIVNRE